MIKLICIDMDGTFLNDKKEISNGNLRAVKKASENGINIAVCTGRLFVSASYYADIIGAKGPIIAANGAYVKDRSNDRIIYSRYLGLDNCRKILKTAQKYNVNANFNAISGIYMSRLTKYADIYKKINKDLPENNRMFIKVVDDWESIFEKDYNNILKCVIIDEDLEKLKKIADECRQIDDILVTSSFYNNIEINNKEVSKGNAVKMLAENYSLSKDEIMCIGDNENDISMIEYAGVGVAMGNGEEKVKKAADYVTDTNNCDGVAKAIERFAF